MFCYLILYFRPALLRFLQMAEIQFEACFDACDGFAGGGSIISPETLTQFQEELESRRALRAERADLEELHEHRARRHNEDLRSHAPPGFRPRNPEDGFDVTKCDYNVDFAPLPTLESREMMSHGKSVGALSFAKVIVNFMYVF